ncbi:hypothetical protein NE237_007643 [Protea cynaroides]|uniref:Retrovirus-related Pol polyprotein from transposon TNT 1-94-like beta-barrel domain-containing protein n=1 Tax=Protea cynaroides TaxID=273540 RepID=A0A9Q0KQK4_9MAGN|nr:hypothetical protein NE237_007643 [Protea cynaroides]
MRNISQIVWYVDTGCGNHMCGSKSSFSHLNEDFHSTVSFGDCSTVNVLGKGDINIRTKNGFVETISNVIHVPDLKSNLLRACLIKLLLLDSMDSGFQGAILE